jgi:Alcohol dehydrogenase GroES-like domain
MRGAVLYAPAMSGWKSAAPQARRTPDAIIGLSASCVCGSDLWPYRGLEAVDGPLVMGHEYAGILQEVGSQVTTSARASSWSAPCSPPTPPASSARPATRAPAATSSHRRRRRPGRVPARPLGRRHPWSPPRDPRRRPGPELAGRPPARGRADHRHEPPRAPPAARGRLRRDRHRHRARRRRGGPDQGAHRRAGRPQRGRGGRHPSIDAAGHPSGSSPTCTCTAAPPRCAGSCPSSSS